MTLQAMLSSGILLTGRKPDEELTEEEIAEVLAEIAADPRVLRAQYLGRRLQGHTAVVIDAIDTKEGDFYGIYNIGRCLDALSENKVGYRDRIASLHAERAASFEPMTARDRQLRAEREDNLRRLKEAGFDPFDLVDYVNRTVNGRYIEPDHPGSDAFEWYHSEIVCGRPRSMRLNLYLANLIEFEDGEFHIAPHYD